MADSEQRCIMVLGMHRSGTSAIARVLNLHGVNLGGDLLPPAPDNPKGFWEHKRIFHVHERLLREIGSVWDDIRPLPDEWWKSQAAQEARSQILEILRTDFKDSRLWGVKDPRLCRLLKLWKQILEQVGCPVYFITVFRNPLEVAASLGTRNGHLQAKSLMLWLRHVLECELETRDYPRVFVSMHGWMADWRLSMDRIAKALGISWPVEYRDVQSDVEVFLDRRLTHHSVSDADVYANPNIPPEIAEVYRGLKDAESHASQSLGSLVSSVDAKLADSLASLKAQELTSFVTTALEQDVQGRIFERSNLRDRIDNLNRELARARRLEAKLEVILNSRSWRMTAPLRSIFNTLQRLFGRASD